MVAALGGTYCGVVYCWWRKIPLRQAIDCALPAILLGLAFGRVGCFLNGDDFGKPIALPSEEPWWGVIFPNLSDNLVRYPVQLWETLFASFFALLMTFPVHKGAPSIWDRVCGVFLLFWICAFSLLG